MKLITFITSSLFALSLYASPYNGGSGTRNDPYQISTKVDFLLLANNEEDSSKHFIMTSNIDLAGETFTNAVISPYLDSLDWEYGETQFTGSFDGNGYVISNLTISAASTHYIGLFGSIGSGGIAKNIRLENVILIGNDYVGGIVGYNEGVVIGSHVLGSISGHKNVGGVVGCNVGVIHSVSASVTMLAVGDYNSRIGGLVGYAKEGLILNSKSEGSVSGTSYVGGFSGENLSSGIDNCYSMANVSGTSYVGAFSGINQGAIRNCYSTGTSTGNPFIGSNYRTAQNNFWDVETSGIGSSGDSSGGATGKTTAEMQSIGTFNNATWDITGVISNEAISTVWQIETSGNNYPKIALFNNYQPPAFSGNGTPETPYLINSPEQLKAIIYYDLAAHYELVNNLDLNGASYPNALIPVFCGLFNGKGFSIINLTIAGQQYPSLFGQVQAGAFVNNIRVDGNISGRGYCAILAGSNSGSISNCHTTGRANSFHAIGGLVGYNDSGIIKYSSSNVEVSGQNVVGGLVGRNEGAILHCSTIGRTQFYGDRGGGLVGQNNAHILCSFATGRVQGGSEYAGGLIGYNSGGLGRHPLFNRVSCCYATGQVSCPNHAGGLVGANSGGIHSPNGRIDNCYATGNVSGENNVGGLAGITDHPIRNSYSLGTVSSSGDAGGAVIGRNAYIGGADGCFWDVQTSGRGTSGDAEYGAIGKTTLEMQMENTFVDAGWDFINETTNGTSGYWQMPDGGGYPQLTAFTDHQPIQLQGDGSEESPYQISSALELGAIDHSDLSAHYQLMNDINLDGIVWANAVIPSFNGTFDGNGFVVSNLVVQGTSHAGLFGVLERDAVIRNIGVENCNVSSTGNSVGGLIGYGFGDLQNCYSIGTVSGAKEVGGLIGFSWNALIEDCFALGTVSGDRYVSGLVGFHVSIIDRCYAACSVSGSQDTGGLTAHTSSHGRVWNCFWDKEISGQSNSQGGIGKTTSEMQDIETFLPAGWNFDSTWLILPNESPKLRAFNDEYHRLQTTYGTGAGFYTNGQVVAINANTASPGFTFVYWNTSVDCANDLFATNPIVTMPPQNLNITAVFMEPEMTFSNWTVAAGLSLEESSISDDPAGDGIPNLAKFTVGLPPSIPFTEENIYTISYDIPSKGIVLSYNKSKFAAASITPMWTHSLLTTNWNTNLFISTKTGENNTEEFWESFFSIVHTNKAFVQPLFSTD